MSAVPSPEVLAPPSERRGTLGWLRKNLFSGWLNTLLTLLTLGLAYAIIRPLAEWLWGQADWTVISVNLRLFMVGQYPQAYLWRIWLCVILLALLIGIAWGLWVRGQPVLGGILALLPLGLLAVTAPASQVYLVSTSLAALLGYGLGRFWPHVLRRPAIAGWLLLFPLVILLVRGVGNTGALAEVPTNLWGGLLLTVLLTIIGILFSFPLGVLLALGRRSRLPIVQVFCVGYIELVRGVPFVTVLFMAQLMLPLFLPANVTLDRVLRAMIGVTLFSAAYLAENVRGGLQAIPNGQSEAARALGLNPWQTTLLIVLPQALRTVIPILVGQFIALFKDTSLVVIVGLLDLLGIAKTVLAQPDFIARQIEVYVFVGALYWVLSYLMSLVSQRLEERLGVGQR